MIASNQRALCSLPAHTDPRELSLLRKVFARSRLRFREVSEKELSLPIGKLAGYSDCREQEAEKSSSPLPEPVLVLCGLPSAKISELLEKMRETGASPIACKAALTDTNRHWSFYRLYEELCREREAMANSAAVRHKRA